MAVKIEQVVETIMSIRAKRAALKAAFTAEDEKLKEAETKGEMWLLAQLNAVGADSIRHRWVRCTSSANAAARLGTGTRLLSGPS